MATSDEAEQALLDAIHRIATTTDPARMNATSLQAAGDAVKSFAEAHSWLIVPNQPH